MEKFIVAVISQSQVAFHRLDRAAVWKTWRKAIEEDRKITKAKPSIEFEPARCSNNVELDSRREQ